MDALLSLPFHYSIAARDLLELTRFEFERWLRRELFVGGVTDERVAAKIHEIVVRATPESARQLLELALQYEGLLKLDLGDPVFADLRARTAREALEGAVEIFLTEPLFALWENLARPELEVEEPVMVDHVAGAGRA